MSDILPLISFFYKDKYDALLDKEFPFNEHYHPMKIASTLRALKQLDLNQDEQSWFNQMKEIAEFEGFAPSKKELKQFPEKYLGTIGDVAEMLRVALAGRKNTPNLYHVMKILGKEECERRITHHSVILGEQYL